jgi:hypothetical protein
MLPRDPAHGQGGELSGNAGFPKQAPLDDQPLMLLRSAYVVVIPATAPQLLALPLVELELAE